MQIRRTWKHHEEWFAVAFIVALAAAVRLGAPGITEFKRDEANMARLALDLVHGHAFPLLGLTSSVNIPNPPVSVYLFAIPFLFDEGPLAATFFVGLLNVAAVLLTWWLARRYYGPFAAASAGLLYAASPWAAIYARKIWAQDLLPPFILVTVITGLLGYGEDRRWARFAHWPLLALTVQIHYASFVLVALSLLILALWRVHVHRRELVIGLALAGMTLLPALVGAYQHGWLSLPNLRERVQLDADHSRLFSTTALDDAWFTVAGTNIHALAGPEQFRAYRDTVPPVWPLFQLVPLGVIAAAASMLWAGVRRRSLRRVDGIMIAWLLLPVLAFTWEWAEVAPHYMIPLMPVAFILFGAGASRLARGMLWFPRRKAVQMGIGAGVAVIAALQVVAFVRLLTFVDTYATPGGFGTPLHYLLDVRDAVLGRAPQDVIVVSTEELAPFDQAPAVWSVLLEAVPDVRFIDGTRSALVPAGAALELVEWSPGLRTCPDRACGAAGDAVIIERRSGEAPYIARPAAGDLPLSDPVMIEPVSFTNGAQLVGYALEEGTVATIWRLPGPVPADYQTFVHVLDETGTRVAQHDRFAWPGRYWRAGDTLVFWFDVPLTPRAAWLFTGLYTTDGVMYQNVGVVDETGAVVATGATLALDG